MILKSEQIEIKQYEKKLHIWLRICLKGPAALRLYIAQALFQGPFVKNIRILIFCCLEMCKKSCCFYLQRFELQAIYQLIMGVLRHVRPLESRELIILQKNEDNRFKQKVFSGCKLFPERPFVKEIGFLEKHHRGMS